MWTASVISVSSTTGSAGLDATRLVRALRALMASALTGQPGNEAVCLSPQLGHLRGMVSQQSGVGLSFPPFTHPWLPHLCASLVCRPEKIGQVGRSSLQSWD